MLAMKFAGRLAEAKAGSTACLGTVCGDVPKAGLSMQQSADSEEPLQRSVPQKAG